MDNIVAKIFRNKVFNKKKLLEFGFKESENSLIFSAKIFDAQFDLIIIVKEMKTIETKLIDSASKEAYTLHLLKGANGKFIGNIRNEYEKFLNKVADNCCDDIYFNSIQANRITEWIKQKYNSSPEFLWDKFPRCAVFRNYDTRKWYGLITDIDYSKLDKNQSGQIDVLNIKVDKDDIQSYLKLKGCYPAYHMNKRSWLSVVLDDSVADEALKTLIDRSYIFSQKK